MVVRVRDRTRLVVDHEHGVELSVEPLVDQHLDGDAAVGEDGRRHACRHGRSADGCTALEPVEIHLAFGEEEEVAVARVTDVERLGGQIGRRLQEEGVARVGTRPRRGHLDPQPTAIRAEGMRHAHRHAAARSGLELHAAPVEIEHRLAPEHVEAGLERMHVRVDVPVDQRDERQRHVCRAARAADEATGRQAARAARQRLAELDVLTADEAVRRPAVCQLACAGVAAHRGTAAGSTTAEEATAAARSDAPSCRLSPVSGTRSAPRT